MMTGWVTFLAWVVVLLLCGAPSPALSESVGRPGVPGGGARLARHAQISGARRRFGDPHLFDPPDDPPVDCYIGGDDACKPSAGALISFWPGSSSNTGPPISFGPRLPPWFTSWYRDYTSPG